MCFKIRKIFIKCKRTETPRLHNPSQRLSVCLWVTGINTWVCKWATQSDCLWMMWSCVYSVCVCWRVSRFLLREMMVCHAQFASLLAEELMGPYLCWLRSLALCAPQAWRVYPPAPCSSSTDGSKSTPDSHSTAMQTDDLLLGHALNEVVSKESINSKYKKKRMNSVCLWFARYSIRLIT